MAIDFPDSPSDNDIYTVNGKRWIYSSGKWSIYGTTSNIPTNFPTSLDAGTGFAAVEALQAKVGVDSSATTTSHDYKITSLETDVTTAQSDITTLETDVANINELQFNYQTASYTLVLSDAGKAVQTAVASANTVTVPPNSSVAFPVGTQILVIQQGAGQTTLAGGAGVTLYSKDGNLKLSAQWCAATLIKADTDVWVVIGDLSA